MEWMAHAIVQLTLISDTPPTHTHTHTQHTAHIRTLHAHMHIIHLHKHLSYLHCTLHCTMHAHMHRGIGGGQILGSWFIIPPFCYELSSIGLKQKYMAKILSPHLRERLGGLQPFYPPLSYAIDAHAHAHTNWWYRRYKLQLANMSYVVRGL